MRTFVVWSQLLVVPVFMLLWVTLLVLAPVSEQLETPPKSMISLQFPWTVFFQEESMELTCKGFGSSYSPRITKWYLGEKKLRETKASTLKVQESGDYTCQAGDLPKSNTVHLDFSKASLILQGPLDVFEGDSVLLRCRARAETELNTLVFYKNNEALILPDNSSCLHLNDVNLEHNGDYYCAGYKEMCCEAYSNAIRIQVQALFPLPVLRTSSDKPTEGSPVTLTCETQLPPQRSDVQLQFRFFKGSRALGAGWSSSPELQIPAMWREDSGSYWCQAKTLISGVLKDSKTSYISVQIPVSRPILTHKSPRTQTVVGDVIELCCEAMRGSFPILYTFYHEDVTLGSLKASSRRRVSFRLSLTAEHSGNYFCEARNSEQTRRSDTMTLIVIIPVSRPVLTLRAPRAQAVLGDVVELHCEALTGSPPILYQFYHGDVTLGNISAPSGGGTSFNLSLTAEHSGNYFCEARNDVQTQRSDTMTLSVTIPVSRPVLTLRAPRAQTVVGDVVELHCEAMTGSPPILYQFYHGDVTLGSSTAPSGGGASFNLSLTAEHSGNYSCEADNGPETQHSEAVTLSVTVPVSHPVLTLRTPRTGALVGDEVELHCEALRGSPPILYWFYHEDVTLGNISAPSGGGASFNLSLTEEHSGNYSCEADNGLGAQRSEVVTLFITGLTENRSGPVATGVTGGLLSVVSLAAGALLFYWLSRKAGRQAASDPSRCSSDSNPQDPTYHNVPGWVGLQPVYMNVNSRGEDVVYSEVWGLQKKNKHSAACAHSLSMDEDSSVIYSKVKGTCTPALGSQQLASPAPHR